MWAGKKKSYQWITLPSYKKWQNYVKIIRQSLHDNALSGLSVLLGLALIIIIRRLFQRRKHRRQSWEGNNFAQLMQSKKNSQYARSRLRPRPRKASKLQKEQSAKYIDVIRVFAQTKTPPRLVKAGKKLNKDTISVMVDKENCENTSNHSAKERLGHNTVNKPFQTKSMNYQMR